MCPTPPWWFQSRRSPRAGPSQNTLPLKNRLGRVGLATASFLSQKRTKETFNMDKVRSLHLPQRHIEQATVSDGEENEPVPEGNTGSSRCTRSKMGGKVCVPGFQAWRVNFCERRWVNSFSAKVRALAISPSHFMDRHTCKGVEPSRHPHFSLI